MRACVCLSVYCVCCIIARSKGAVQRAGSDDQSLRPRPQSAKKHQSPTASSSMRRSPLPRPPTAAAAKLLFTSASATDKTGPTSSGGHGGRVLARGLHFDRLFQIQIDYHLERAASLTRAGGSRRGEAAGEEQRVDGKINFPSEHCASPRSVVGWMGDRPTDNRAKSTIAIVLLHFLSTTSPQWQSRSRRSQWMSERAAMGGISQVAQPVHSQSQSLSGVLRCTFRPFLVLSILLPLLRSPLCDCSVTV